MSACVIMEAGASARALGPTALRRHRDHSYRVKEEELHHKRNPTTTTTTTSTSTPYSHNPKEPQRPPSQPEEAAHTHELQADSPPPPPPLDPHELDLTPRLLDYADGAASHHQHHHQKRHHAAYHVRSHYADCKTPTNIKSPPPGCRQCISPQDESICSSGAFSHREEDSCASPPAAIYAEPALERRIISGTEGHQKAGPLSSFSKGGGGAASRHRRWSATQIPRRNVARDRNSLESVQSRCSRGSSSRAPSPQLGSGGGGRQLASASSSVVLVGTRFVRPPAVPPLSPPQPTVRYDEWREVPLADLTNLVETKRPEVARPRPLRALWSPARALKSHREVDRTPPTHTGSKPQLQQQLNGGSQKQAARGKSPEILAIDSEQPLSAKKSFAGANNDERQRAQEPNGQAPESPQSGDSTPRPSSHGAAQIGKSRAPFLFAGILASILGSLFFSLAILTIKLLPDGSGLAEKTKIVAFRGLTMMLLCAGTILYNKSTFIVRRDELLVNVLRSLLGFAGVYGAYISLKYISMGDATALVFSSPVWTSLLSHFILNEPLQWVQLLALPLSLLGIVLIAHPSLLISEEEIYSAADSGQQRQAAILDLAVGGSSGGNYSTSLDGATSTIGGGGGGLDYDQRWKGILIALGTSFIVSFVYIVLKFRKTTPIQTTTFWLGATTLVGALTISACVGFGSWPRAWSEWALLLVNGLCSWLGQCLLQWGLKYEDASVLSVVRTLDVAMNFALSALFLQEQILWTSVLGAAIIAAVVVSIMLNNYISARLCGRAAAAAAAAAMRDPDGSPAESPSPGGGPNSLRSSITLSTGELVGGCEPVVELPPREMGANLKRQDATCAAA